MSPDEQLRLAYLALAVTLWLVGFAGAEKSYPEAEANA